MSKNTGLSGGSRLLPSQVQTILGRSLNHANDSKGLNMTEQGNNLKVSPHSKLCTVRLVEKGESDGYEVAVPKSLDEKPPDYKFEYTEQVRRSLDRPRNLVKAIGTKGANTEERAKKFIIPKETNRCKYHRDFTKNEKKTDKYKNIDDFKERKIVSNFTTNVLNGMLLKNTMKV